MAARDLLVELAKGGVKKFAPFPVDVFILYFINELTMQGRIMMSLDQKLDQHIVAPFNKGKLLIGEARNATSSQEKKEFIVNARSEFFSAVSIMLPEYPILPVRARVYVGVCYDLLSNPNNALRWYRKAYQEIIAMIKFQDEKHVSDWLDYIFKPETPYVSYWPRYFDLSLFQQSFRESEIVRVYKSGDLKKWPLGEKKTFEMLALASRLTDLVQSRSLKLAEQSKNQK